jgi:aryl-alcohol dehydrogenase-like predicted oxidoreductase
MEKRKLGRSALETAPFALGGNVFGWTIDEPASFRVLDAFTGAGFNFIDTADSYSTWAPGNKGGESETILGNWMTSRGNRKAVLIATKVGSDMGEGKNLKKKYILRAAEASLKRLQTDYIDLYQSHWDDVNTPVEETLEAYEQLIKEGKVRFIGASNFSKERLASALDAAAQKNLPRYETFQPRYNLFDREEYETEYQELCVRREVGVIPYYGLASGFLTGKYRSENDLSKSARGGGIQKYLTPRGLRILDALDEVAKQYSVRPATIALAWLMARPGIAAPIASATSPEQLEDLTKAVSIKLDQRSIEMLENASAYQTEMRTVSR